MSARPPLSHSSRPLLVGTACGLLASCFSPSVVDGLPCSRDETCGPDHDCVLGYCRPAGFDGLAACGDGTLTQGEFCFPDDVVQEVAFAGMLREIAWADYDANGFVDVLTISETATVHLNMGDRTFETANLVVELSADELRARGFDIPEGLPFSPTVIPRHLAVGDFAGNDLPDAILALAFDGGSEFEGVQMVREQLTSILWLAENLGDGQILVAPLPSTGPLGSEQILGQGMQSGDFDGDGETDLVVVSQAPMAPAQAHVMLGTDAEDVLTPPIPVPLGASGAPQVGDFNGDGLSDLATADGRSNTVAVVLGPFDGVPELLGLDEPPLGVHLADVDDDDRLDIVVLFEGETVGFQPWFGDGNGEFEEGTAVQTDSIAWVATGDLDGDGIVDVASVGADGLLVHPGYGAGSFGVGFVLHDDVASFVGAFALDDDDALDLVTGSPSLAALYFAEP